MPPQKRLLRFKLCEETVQAINQTSEKTHISKSEIMRLAIQRALPEAETLDLSSKKSIGATNYSNIYVEPAVYERIHELAESTKTAKIASVTRALIEHAIERNDYLPTT